MSYGFLGSFKRRSVASLALVSLCTSFFPTVSFAAPPVVFTTLSVEKTGSEPFDAQSWDGVTLSTAGLDESEDDMVVRLQDSITYKAEVSINDSDVDQLTSTVILDKRQAWIELPTGCRTLDSVPNVTSNPSYISADKRELFCNLGPAIEGTTKVFFPTARVIGASFDGTQITLNDQMVNASSTAQADGLSNIANSQSNDVTVTANFRINTTKDLKVPDADTDGDGNPEVIYVAPAKTGPAGEEGVLMEYVIKTTYERGSMIANSANEAGGDFEVDYDLFDFYTDNNDNNNNVGPNNLSTNGVLYTWDPATPACELVGDHGANATASCTPTAIVGDHTGPAFTPDGVNDPGIEIDLNNIDTRDPDADTNLIELKVNLWFPRADDLQTHQSCASGVCENFTINTVGTYNTITSTVEGFNPISTEDTGGNNLPNYNGAGEPTFGDQTRDYMLIYIPPGGFNFDKTFGGHGWIGPHKWITEDYGSPGEIVPVGLLQTYTTPHAGGEISQICDKIDPQSFEFVGLSDIYDTKIQFWPQGKGNNPSIVLYNPGQPYPNIFYTIDGSRFTEILFSTEPNSTLIEQRDDTCDDDVDGDGFVVIMDENGNLIDENGNSTSGVVDWYKDAEMVPGGESNISKIRQQFKPDYSLLVQENEKVGLKDYNRAIQFVSYDLKIKETATGYGPRPYLANFSSVRTGINGSMGAWTHDSTDTLDENDVSFSLASGFSDRLVFVDSNHSIAKQTLPKGLKVIRGGDDIDFIITPAVHGLWDSAIDTVNVTDTLPVDTYYVSGTEQFSVDGGTTWLNRLDYDASAPDVTITSASHGPNANPLVWDFGSVNSGDQLPMIKYTVNANPDLTSGTFTNTATITSDIGVDDDTIDSDSDGVNDTGDGVSDPRSATYQLTILPEYGFDVLKTTTQEVESVNTSLTFDLSYRNLGGEAYTGGRFIDILPFNGDNLVGIGGLNSARTPASNFNGTYEFTSLTRPNNETIYVTDIDPTTLNLDACASSNTPNGYTPLEPNSPASTARSANEQSLDALCYQDYINNGNMLPDMQASGTDSAEWQVCSPAANATLDTANDCPIDPELVTAFRFDTLTVPTTGAQSLILTLTPKNNIGGDPVYETNANGSQSVDYDNSPNIGDFYTNSFGGRVPEISLNVISNDVTVTVVSGSIGDRVWYDVNNDGVQDAGEPGIENVTMNLLDAAGTPIYVDSVTGLIVASTDTNAIPYTTTTNENGEYEFINLSTGDYQVQVDDSTLPPSPTRTQTFDADGTGTPHISSYTLPLTSNELGYTDGVEDNEDQDFGYYYEPLFDIGDFVWEDINMDGVQDLTESGLENIKVNLLNSTGGIIASTVTDSNGAYLFEDIISGEYYVEVEVPKGYALSPSGAGGDNVLDSDIDRSTSRTTLLDFTIPYNDMNIDAGIFELEDLTLGGTVFNDLNDDTLYQSENEMSIESVEVHLYEDVNNDGVYDSGDIYLGSSTTDASGNYLFTNLSFGEYIVVIPQTNFNSGSTLENWRSSDDTLTINDPDNNTKNEDNGSQGGTSGTGTLISSQAVTLLQGTEPIDDGDNDVDTNLSIDFGVILPIGSISGQVLEFLNGIAQTNIPMAGVEISLYADADGDGAPDTTVPISTTTTDVNGDYIFTDLPFGDYVVVQTQPEGFKDYSQVDGGDDTDSNSTISVENRISGNIGPGDSNKDDSGNIFTEIRLISIGGGTSSSSNPQVISVSPSTPSNPEPVVTEVEKPIVAPEEPEIEPSQPEPVKQNIPEIEEIKAKIKKYEQKTPVERIIPFVVEDNIPGETFIKTLPAILPKTGTPISERIGTLESRIVNTQLPSSETFRLAGDTNEDISHWKQVLPEQDRDAGRYVVLPSNGLVIPVNSFAEDSKDFDAMINGREGNINPALRSGALEYPGSSTKGYGEIGNKVIFGHSSYFANELGRYKTHFQKIIELDEGEEIWIYEKQENNQYKRYRYKTEKSYNTDDSDTSVLLPGVGKNLTLFTCTPIGGIEGRWIIKAKFIEENEKNNKTQTEYIGYFDTLSPQLKRFVSRLISTIETIDQEDKRLSMYYRVYDRLGIILSQEDDEQRKLLLEYVEYKVIEKILAFQE